MEPTPGVAVMITAMIDLSSSTSVTILPTTGQRTLMPG